MVNDWNPVGESFASPKWSAGMDYPIQRVYHIRGVSQQILLAILTVDNNDLEIADFTSVFDCEYNHRTMLGTLKTKETIIFDDDSTIELSIVERANYATLTFEGTFVGHGTGALKGVKIVGTTFGGVADWSTFTMGFTREGTIMGYPT